MFNWIRKGVSKLDSMLNKPLSTESIKWLELEITEWLESKERKKQLDGERYYKGDQDITKAKRMVIGEDGKLVEVDNLPNHKIVDNQYKKLVNQKVNHLVGKPFIVDTENEAYKDRLEKQYFNKKFMKLLKSVCKDGQNGGISYLYPYYENNELKFRRFKSSEVKVYWKDADHDEIDFFIHWYTETVRMNNGTKEDIEHVEVYTSDGVSYYIRKKGTLLFDDKKQQTTYLTRIEMDAEDNVLAEERLNFERIPLIPFKISDDELPLLNRVRSLQDGINTIVSTFMNNMMEEPRNTILVLVNYDGQDLAEFRQNLAQYGVVKVRNDASGTGGDLRSLQVEVNSENWKAILEIFKKTIIQNGGGVDLTELRSTGTPNQMNIQSMYYDIELDTNDTETEYQSAFEELLWFINFDLNYRGEGNFFDEDVDIIFNRDKLSDETSIIDNLMKLKGTISDEDIIKQLPFGDATKLIENMKKQKEEEKAELDDYSSTFKPQNNPLEPSSKQGDMQ